MRGFLILCAMCAVVFLGLVGFACAAEVPVAPPASTWTLDMPVELTAGPVCVSPAACAACPGRNTGALTRPRSPRLQSGQPVRNVGRVALVPARAVRAAIAARPLRRVGRAVLDAAPGRRLARAAFAPVRWLLR